MDSTFFSVDKSLKTNINLSFKISKYKNKFKIFLF